MCSSDLVFSFLRVGCADNGAHVGITVPANGIGAPFRHESAHALVNVFPAFKL